MKGTQCASHFLFNGNVLVNQLRSSLTIFPTPIPEWPYACAKGSTRAFKGGKGVHMCHCAHQGCAYVKDAAVLGQLRARPEGVRYGELNGEWR